MTEPIPIKEFDGFPPDLVRPHLVRRRNTLGIFGCGALNMARGQLAFKQTDVTRALRGVSKAGQPVQRIEINREGKIIIFVAKAHEERELGDNEWDNL